jgi:hypothetical protein
MRKPSRHGTYFALWLVFALRPAWCAREGDRNMTTPGEPQYFGAFTGYNVPLKPMYPIDYAKAESSEVFCVFVFDANERIVLMENWLAHAKGATVTGLHDLKPGLHFFAVDATQLGRVGAEMPLENTKKAAEYYRVRVGDDGTTQVEQVSRELTLRQTYAYWDNGKVRETKVEGGDEPATVEQYDRRGKLIKP